jgi:hypothetical protein
VHLPDADSYWGGGWGGGGGNEYCYGNLCRPIHTLGRRKVRMVCSLAILDDWIEHDVQLFGSSSRFARGDFYYI